MPATAKCRYRHGAGLDGHASRTDGHRAVIRDREGAEQRQPLADQQRRRRRQAHALPPGCGLWGQPELVRPPRSRPDDPYLAGSVWSFHLHGQVPEDTLDDKSSTDIADECAARRIGGEPVSRRDVPGRVEDFWRDESRAGATATPVPDATSSMRVSIARAVRSHPGGRPTPPGRAIVTETPRMGTTKRSASPRARNSRARLISPGSVKDQLLQIADPTAPTVRCLPVRTASPAEPSTFVRWYAPRPSSSHPLRRGVLCRLLRIDRSSRTARPSRPALHPDTSKPDLLISRNAEEVWLHICRYLQKWIAPTDDVLELGAGWCDFANNVAAASCRGDGHRFDGRQGGGAACAGGSRRLQRPAAVRDRILRRRLRLQPARASGPADSHVIARGSVEGSPSRRAADPACSPTFGSIPVAISMTTPMSRFTPIVLFTTT